MKRSFEILRQIFILTGFLLLPSRVLFSDEFDLPPLSTDAEKIQFLSAVEKNLPDLFLNEKSYSGALLDTLEKERALAAFLQENKEFRALQGERPKLKRIEIVYPKTQARAEVDPAAFDAWKNDVLKSLPPEAGHERLAEYLGKAQAAAKAGVHGNPAGFLTGLIKTLPPPLQSAVFQAPFPEQVKLLEKDLPDDVIAAGFKASFYGIHAPHLKKDEALEVLKKRMSASEGLSRLLQTQILAETLRLPKEIGVAEARNAILAASPSQARELLEPTARKRIEELLPSKDQAGFLAGQIEKKLKGISAQGAPDRVVETPGLILEEAPPFLGVLRGCAGNDCSTSSSLGYPWSPKERVYWIKDEAGSIKGYASGTLVRHQDKNAIYLHTINGRVSERQTEDILQGLYEVRKDLGAEELILPAAGRLHQNVNTEGIRRGFSRYIENSETVPIVHLDAEVRRIIDNTVESVYDTEESNRKGILFDPKRRNADRPGLSVRALENGAGDFHVGGTSKGDLLRLALDFSYAGEKESAGIVKKMIQSGMLTSAEVASAKKVLENPRRKKVQAYLQDIRDFLSQKGSAADVEFLKRKTYWLSTGFLKAPDAFSPENERQAVTLVLSQIREKAERVPKSVLKWIEKRPDVFAKSEKFSRFLDEMIHNEKFDLEAVNRIIEVGGWPKLPEIVRKGAMSADAKIQAFAYQSIPKFDFPRRPELILELLQDPETNPKHLGSLYAGASRVFAVGGRKEASRFKTNLHELARSSQVEMRVRALNALEDSLGLLSPNSENLQMVKFLGDDSPEVRKAAQAALRKTGAAIGAYKEKLLEILRTGDSRMRAGVLGTFGKEIHDADLKAQVIAAMRDDDPEVRSAALRAKGRGRTADWEIFRLFAKNLSHPDPRVRAAAIFGLSNSIYVDKPTAENIGRYLDDSNAEVRKEALAAYSLFDKKLDPKLRGIYDKVKPRTREKILGLLRDKEPEVVADAARIITRGNGDVHRTAKEQEELIAALRRSDPATQKSIRSSLAMVEIDSPTAKAMIVEGLRSDGPAARLAYSEWLGGKTVLGKELQVELAKSLDSEDDKVRYDATKALRRIWQGQALLPKVREALLARGNDPLFEVRSTVFNGALNLGLTDAEIVKYLKTGERTQQFAIGVAKQKRKWPRQINDAVLDLVRNGPNRVRGEALRAYASHNQLGTKEIPLILSAAGDPSPDTRSLAIKILGTQIKAGPAEQIFLAGKLGDPDENVRIEAMNALREMKIQDPEVLKSILPFSDSSTSAVRKGVVKILAGFPGVRKGRSCLATIMHALKNNALH